MSAIINALDFLPVENSTPDDAYGWCMGQADNAADYLSAKEASQQEYARLLDAKTQSGAESGFAPRWIPRKAFPFQESLIDYAVRGGRRAIFADCGLGKTLIELAWAQNVAEQTNGNVLYLTPLAVSSQVVREAEKFGVEAVQSRDGSVAHITVTNYEQLHRYDWKQFKGVVCDESSILKSFDGSLRNQITEFMRKVPYRFLGTATAAPNDYTELGTSSEALGYLGHIEMLNRFFKNDKNTSDTKLMNRKPISRGGPDSAGWRFKGHADLPFWQYICSWSRACRRPSDLGFDDGPFILPRLIERDHVVMARTLAPGMLFPTVASNMREEREERRRTIRERCEMAAELVANTGKPFVIWCQLNDEGDMLEEMLSSDVVQVSGDDSDELKVDKYDCFRSGQVRGIITKHKIGGWGLNWQHCPHVVEFATHSYEAHYQGVRRCWRFGQTEEVVNDVIYTEGQLAIRDNMRRKSQASDAMFTALVQESNAARGIKSGYNFTKDTEVPSWL